MFERSHRYCKFGTVGLAAKCPRLRVMDVIRSCSVGLCIIMLLPCASSCRSSGSMLLLVSGKLKSGGQTPLNRGIVSSAFEHITLRARCWPNPY